jgi:hypothetical protein
MNKAGKEQVISAKSVPPKRRKDKPLTTNQMIAMFRKVLEEPQK